MDLSVKTDYKFIRTYERITYKDELHGIGWNNCIIYNMNFSVDAHADEIIAPYMVCISYMSLY